MGEWIGSQNTSSVTVVYTRTSPCLTRSRFSSAAIPVCFSIQVKGLLLLTCPWIQPYVQYPSPSVSLVAFVLCLSCLLYSLLPATYKSAAGIVCLFVLRGSWWSCDFLYYRWNYALSGLNPWSYHAVNVILHAAVSALFAWLCRNCLGLSKLSSLLTASLFAIHPIHTEAVTSFNIYIRTI